VIVDHFIYLYKDKDGISMSSSTMTKEEVQQIARDIIAFRDRIAPFDLYRVCDTIVKLFLKLRTQTGQSNNLHRP